MCMYGILSPMSNHSLLRYKRWVWDDASDCAANMLSSIAKGQGFAEVLFKSIRVLGGGSDVQA